MIRDMYAITGPSKKMKRFAIAAGILVVGVISGFIFYTYIQPQLNKKTANEQLSDIMSTSQAEAPVRQAEVSPSPSPPTHTPEPQPQAVPPQPMPPSAPTPATQPTTPPAPSIVRQGQFRGVEGEQVSGTGSIVSYEGKNYLRLENDFQSSVGPDLYVGFGDNNKPNKDALFARLKATSGGQNYEIPAHIDPSRYSQVFVHCKIYNHIFGIAELQ